MFTKHSGQPIFINSTTEKRSYKILDRMERQWNVDEKVFFNDKLTKSISKKVIEQMSLWIFYKKMQGAPWTVCNNS